MPIAATVVPDSLHPLPLVADYQPERPERRARPAPRAAATGRSVVSASRTGATMAAAQKAVWEPPLRHVPRPLSPGEFGRR
jgi:hypothetical protein